METITIFKKDGVLEFNQSEYDPEHNVRIEVMNWELDILIHSTKEEVDLLLFNKLMNR